MSDISDFEKDTTTRLARIETRIDAIAAAAIRINEINDRTNEALLSSKSAHHRIDEVKTDFEEYKSSIRWTIGISATIAGIIVGIVDHFV